MRRQWFSFGQAARQRSSGPTPAPSTPLGAVATGAHSGAQPHPGTPHRQGSHNRVGSPWLGSGLPWSAHASPTPALRPPPGRGPSACPSAHRPTPQTLPQASHSCPTSKLPSDTSERVPCTIPGLCIPSCGQQPGAQNMQQGDKFSLETAPEGWGYAQSQGQVPTACHPEEQSWDPARWPRLVSTARTRRTLQAVPPPPGTSQRDIGSIQLIHFPAKKTDIQLGLSPDRRWSKAEPQTGVAPSIQREVTSFPDTCGQQSQRDLTWSQ